jgi:sugar lactone lactonase YvrE
MTPAIVTLVGITACSGPGQLAATSPRQSAGAVVKRATGSGLTFTVYTAGQTPGFLSTAAAVDLAPDSAGNMWFTDGGTPAIGRISSDGTVSEFTTGLPQGAEPYSIVAGPDGNMWFSDYRGVALGEVTSDGTITEYSASQYTNSKAMGIAIGKNGEPWIVGFGSQPLLAYLNASGTIAAQQLPTLMTPRGALTTDAKGNLWFVALSPKARGELVERRANKPGLIRTNIHMQNAATPCCPNIAAKSIVIGPDGDPWFTTLDFAHSDSRAQFLGTFSDGKVKLMRVRSKGLSESAIPSGLAATSDGFWMTGSDPFASKGALWHVNIRGRMIDYNLPYAPRGLTADASGNPWFTAAFPGKPSSIVEVTGAR